MQPILASFLPSSSPLLAHPWLIYKAAWDLGVFRHSTGFAEVLGQRAVFILLPAFWNWGGSSDRSQTTERAGARSHAKAALQLK